MCTHPARRSLRRSLLVLIAIAGTGAAAPAAWAQVEQCEADGKWINLNHGGMTANLTGVVRCTRDGKPTREIPYVNGKVHGVQKRFGGMGSSGQVVHAEYREGKRNGIQRTFDAEGRLVSEITFADDRESGPSRHFHANGKVKRETMVAAPDQLSLTHDYDEQGRLEGVTCGRQVTSPAGRGTCRYRDYNGVLETFWPSTAPPDPARPIRLPGEATMRGMRLLIRRTGDMILALCHRRASFEGFACGEHGSRWQPSPATRCCRSPH